MHIHHRNLVILGLGIFFGIFLYFYPPFHRFIESLGNLGYLGAFLAGMAYDSTVTVTASLVTLSVLAEKFSPFEIALIAGLGAAVGDYIIFRFVHDDLVRDLQPIFNTVLGGVNRVGFVHRRLISLRHISRTHYFHWTMPLLAAVLIGSPFPNELAIGLMGTTSIKPRQFVIIDFLVNFTGIFLVVSAVNLIGS